MLKLGPRRREAYRMGEGDMWIATLADPACLRGRATKGEAGLPWPP